MPNDILTSALKRLAGHADLSQDEAFDVLVEIMSGRVSEVQTAAVLMALRMKGETADEIVGLASAMTQFTEKVDFAADIILDTCGTGGDHSNTFNISTAAALVAAGAGAQVAKHGNRSATSACGSADVLEELGVRIDLEPAQVAACLQRIGIGFMFAPLHHKAMKHVAPVRRQLGVRTVFNIIGPLTNPAGARHQLIGVFDGAYIDILAEAVRMMGSQRNLIVHSDDGLDEISTTCETRVVEVFAGEHKLKRYTVWPEQFGLERAHLDDLRGGTVADNAAIVRDVLSGTQSPRRDIVLLNAGAALFVAEMAGSIADGVELARRAIDDGSALAKLHELIAVSNELATPS